MVAREVGFLFPIVLKSGNIMNALSAIVIITSHFCNYILYLCLCSAFLTSPMYKHMRDVGVWKVTTDTPSPWLWWHSSQVLIDVPEIYGYVEIDTNSFLSNTHMWCLFLLLPSCPVMLSCVFKENLSWAITSLCYASSSSQEQAELWFLKNRLVGDSFFPPNHFWSLPPFL